MDGGQLISEKKTEERKEKKRREKEKITRMSISGQAGLLAIVCLNSVVLLFSVFIIFFSGDYKSSDMYIFFVID